MRKFVQDNAPYLLVAGLILLIVYWIWGRDRGAPEPSASHTSGVETPVEGLQIRPQQDQAPKLSQWQIEEARKNAARELMDGLKRIPVVHKGKSLHFTVRTKTEGRGCQVGDFDQLKSLAHNPREKLFLLSVEPIEGRGKPQAKRLNLAQIQAGSPLSVDLPLSGDLQFFGIYICAGGKDLKSCGKKPPMRRADWRRASTGARVFDKSMYFQLIASRGDEAYLLPNERWDEKTLEGLQAQLGKRGGLGAGFERMRLMLGALGSIGASIGDKGLEITLGYRGPSCE